MRGILPDSPARMRPRRDPPTPRVRWCHAGAGHRRGPRPGARARPRARGRALGYHSLWSNDAPGAPGLETLAQFAAAAPGLDLGVLPLQRYEPRAIAADVERLGLDPA